MLKPHLAGHNQIGFDNIDKVFFSQSLISFLHANIKRQLAAFAAG